MNYRLFSIAFLVACASTRALAAAPSTPIAIEHPYSHPTAAPGVPGVGFFTLINRGSKADRLISVQSPVAGSVEIHQSQVKDGVMQMRAVTEGVTLPVGKPVAFAPGGLHLMLFSLREPLQEGVPVPVTLTFERAGTVTTRLQVEPREPPSADADHSQHQH
ncbi:MAG: copper chaperone PCu(A)C [Stagnimonas sp.]|nr:copper chaperone PCu(A)C [Stagnimonas sp.]